MIQKSITKTVLSRIINVTINNHLYALDYWDLFVICLFVIWNFLTLHGTRAS